MGIIISVVYAFYECCVFLHQLLNFASHFTYLQVVGINREGGWSVYCIIKIGIHCVEL